jgi:hypothetical protein
MGQGGVGETGEKGGSGDSRYGLEDFVRAIDVMRYAFNLFPIAVLRQRRMGLWDALRKFDERGINQASTALVFSHATTFSEALVGLDEIARFVPWNLGKVRKLEVSSSTQQGPEGLVGASAGLERDGVADGTAETLLERIWSTSVDEALILPYVEALVGDRASRQFERLRVRLSRFVDVLRLRGDDLDLIRGEARGFYIFSRIFREEYEKVAKEAKEKEEKGRGISDLTKVIDEAGKKAIDRFKQEFGGFVAK